MAETRRDGDCVAQERLFMSLGNTVSENGNVSGVQESSFLQAESYTDRDLESQLIQEKVHSRLLQC